VAAFFKAEVPTSPPIRIRIGKDIPVMADEEKKTEPVQPLTEDILRKMAASGKSLPSVKPALPPEERTT
jgi:hypothetical protein